MCPSALSIYCKIASCCCCCCCCWCCSVICWLRINIKFKTKSTTKLTGCDADDMWGITDMVQRFSFCSWVKRSDEWQVWQANRWHTFTWSVGVSCVQELVRDAECFCGCVDSCVWLQCDLRLLQELSMCLWKQRWLPYTDIWGEDNKLAVLNPSKNSLLETHCVHANTHAHT